jgi:DNA repair exonuclease SbcCD nuclease subunit
MEKITMMIKDERVALVTDIHVGKHQNSTKWHKIALGFAEEFRDKIKSDNIKDIIICGDVNDDRSDINVHSLHVLNEMFDMWKDFNINVLVGNHDAYYKNKTDVNSLSLLSGWSNINVIDKMEKFSVFGKKFVFCPWGVDPEDIPKCDYIFGHLEINGFSLATAKICTKGIDSTNLLAKADLTVSGHFHIRESRKYKTGKIVYLGSPYEMDWGDCGTPERGFHYFDIPTGEFEFFPITSAPKHKKIRLSEITSAGKLTENIKKDISGNFVNLIIDQDTLTEEQIQSIISGLQKLTQYTIRPDHIFESRASVEETEFDFTSVNIRSSINEFIKQTDYDNKDEILDKIYELYDVCTKGDV